MPGARKYSHNYQVQDIDEKKCKSRGERKTFFTKIYWHTYESIFYVFSCLYSRWGRTSTEDMRRQLMTIISFFSVQEYKCHIWQNYAWILQDIREYRLPFVSVCRTAQSSTHCAFHKDAVTSSVIFRVLRWARTGASERPTTDPNPKEVAETANISEVVKTAC